MVWRLEHFRLYIYGKPIKLLTDQQALKSIIKRNRSTKTYSARLTRWLDRLAHFSINVSHIASKHLALTDYLSRNLSAPQQPADAYDEEKYSTTSSLFSKVPTWTTFFQAAIPWGMPRVCKMNSYQHWKNPNGPFGSESLKIKHLWKDCCQIWVEVV